MSTLSLKNINKIYDNNVQAVFDFNLDIKDKEFIVFVGPSGCGKSTTLRMIAGLEDITSGELYIDGNLVNSVEPKDRDIAMVFQNYALYPHMSVYDNMAFGLKLRKLPMPLYQQSEEVDALVIENKALLKQAHALNRQFKKKQNNLEILEPRAEIYKQIYDNLNKIAEIRVPVKGINEYQIAKHLKAITSLQNDIKRLSALRDGKYANEEDIVKVIVRGIEQRELQLSKLQSELEYYQNNETPLTKLRKLTSFEIEIEINKTAESIDLVRYLFRKPSALSGGQRQRVALGRAIVRKPKVFLMDEPLSNLDAKLRVQTRSEIIKIHERVGATTIYVTHDQTEAMTMADRIVIMKDGYVQQIGSPNEVYNDPSNMFVGGFIGSPSMNFLTGKLVGDTLVFDEKEFTVNEEESTNSVGEFKLKIPKQYVSMLKPFDGKNIVLGARPENIHLKDSKLNENPSNALSLVCDFAELLGNELILYTYMNGQKIVLKAEAKSGIKNRSQIKVCFDTDKLYFFNSENGLRIK